MKYLLDTNILLRLIEKGPQHQDAAEALLTLRDRDCLFFVFLQNISEFWNVCTRSKVNNGLGLSIAETDSHLLRFEQLFTVLPDTLEVYENWRKLIVELLISGVKVHDAKIVAAMKAHDIEYLLTFNTKDFKCYTGIKAVEPKDV